MPTNNDIDIAADQFAEELARLLENSVVSTAPVQAMRHGHKTIVALYDNQNRETALKLPGTDVELGFKFLCGSDSSNRFLAIQNSRFLLAPEGYKEPIIRFEYESSDRAHLHVHGENGAVGHILIGQRKQPPKLQRLHLPVGGKRFRPSLEDVIEFAVEEFGVTPKDGWRRAIAEGRRKWSRKQLASAVRDDPETAREALDNLKA